MSEKENNVSPTALATKGMYHGVIAKQYFEAAADNSSFTKKRILNEWAKKIEYIENDYLSRCPQEQREAFREQMLRGDTLFFDSIFESLLLLNDQQRNQVENILIAIAKGEEVKIARNEPSY